MYLLGLPYTEKIRLILLQVNLTSNYPNSIIIKYEESMYEVHFEIE